MAISLTDEIEVKTKKGKLAAAKQIFLEGDKETIQQIGEKTHQLEEAIKDITATGGASTANAVSYSNETSGMTAVTAQGAIDELAAKNKSQESSISTKAEKADVQSSVSELKAKNTSQDAEIAKKANSADVGSLMKTEQERVNTELSKKFDYESISQELGANESKVVSQATSTKFANFVENGIPRIRFKAEDFKVTKKENDATKVILTIPDFTQWKFSDVVLAEFYKVPTNFVPKSRTFEITKNSATMLYVDIDEPSDFKTKAINEIEKDGHKIVPILIVVQGKIVKNYLVEPLYEITALKTEVNSTLANKFDKAKNLYSSIAEPLKRIAIVPYNEGVDGYVSGNNADGRIMPNTGKHIIVKVNIGKTYNVYVPPINDKYAPNAGIAFYPTAESTSGVRYTRLSIGVSAYTVVATDEYMALSSFGSDKENSYFAVYENMLDGIVPSSKQTINAVSSENAGYLESSGILCLKSNIPNKAFLTKLEFYANKKGKLLFGLGSIDQRNWAIIGKTFALDVVEGYNEVDITKLGLVVTNDSSNLYLFVYNNYYDGCSIGYYSSSTNNLVYSDTTEGALSTLVTSQTPNGASVNLKITYSKDELMFTTNQKTNEVNEWVVKNVNLNAYNHFHQGEFLINGVRYKFNSNNEMEKVEYKNIVLFGNSMQTHISKSTYLEPVVIDGNIWNYTGEKDTEGMDGMSGRGMGATQQAFDYKHLLRTALKEYYTDVKITGTTIVPIERELPNELPSYIMNYITAETDVLIWRVGENVSNFTEDYYRALKRYIKQIKNKNPNIKVVVTSRFWINDVADKYSFDAARDTQSTFLWMRYSDSEELANAKFLHEYPVAYNGETKTVIRPIYGGGGHPSNLGYYLMANKILELMGIEKLDIVHNIRIINNTSASFSCNSKQIEGGLCTLVLNTSDISIKCQTKTGKGIEIQNISDTNINNGNDWYFYMPNEDVVITLNSKSLTLS